MMSLVSWSGFGNRPPPATATSGGHTMRISYEEAVQVCRTTPGAEPRIDFIDNPAQLPASVEQAGSGFFDWEKTGDEFDSIALEWAFREGKETFQLKSRLAYLDKELGVFL